VALCITFDNFILNLLSFIVFFSHVVSWLFWRSGNGIAHLDRVSYVELGYYWDW